MPLLSVLVGIAWREAGQGGALSFGVVSGVSAVVSLLFTGWVARLAERNARERARRAAEKIALFPKPTG